MRHDECIHITDLDHLIYQRQIDGARNHVLANSFGLVGVCDSEYSRFEELLVQRTDRISADHLDLWILFLEILGDSADGPTSTHSGNQMGDLSVSVVPDLWTGGDVVSMGIPLVEVLIGAEGVLGLFGDLFRHRIIGSRIFRIDRRRADDHFRSEGSEQLRFLFRHLIRHGEDCLVSTDACRESQTQSSVSGCTLDNRATRLDRTLSLCGIDHVDCDAILDRPTGVESLELGHDGSRETAADPVESNQWCSPHRFQDVIVNLHCSSSTPRIFSSSYGPSQFNSLTPAPDRSLNRLPQDHTGRGLRKHESRAISSPRPMNFRPLPTFLPASLGLSARIL